MFWYLCPFYCFALSYFVALFTPSTTCICYFCPFLFRCPFILLPFLFCCPFYPPNHLYLLFCCPFYSSNHLYFVLSFLLPFLFCCLLLLQPLVFVILLPGFPLTAASLTLSVYAFNLWKEISKFLFRIRYQVLVLNTISQLYFSPRISTVCF